MRRVAIGESFWHLFLDGDSLFQQATQISSADYANYTGISKMTQPVLLLILIPDKGGWWSSIRHRSEILDC